MKIKEYLINFMNENEYKPMKKGQLAKIFDINKREMKDFVKLLSDMEKEGLIYLSKDEKYYLPDKLEMIIGKLDMNPKGFGFLRPDNKEIKDIFISKSYLNGALNGDKVMIKLISPGGTNKKAEGEVIKIIERRSTKLVGTFQESQNFGFVVPDDKRITTDVFIRKSDINGAKNGQKVVVEVTNWPEEGKSAEGYIEEILGYIGDPGTDILSIVRRYNLSETFPEKVIEQAENIPEEIPDDEIRRRLDLRNEVIFTIDGADAKDLDDAVSIEKLDNGNYKLGVHIADVTHYVKENSPLDKEALRRGTSVYLVDRVIPMLPRKLSNGMCSLHPNVDRLTLSVFMEIDNKGKVLNHKIVETIINSKARLVYTDISNILENDDEDLKEKFKEILPQLKNMEQLAAILRKKRENRGAIDFDFPEAYVVLDDKGKPVEIKKAERRVANKIIEDFMLICNETVAEYMYWTENPFVYRIHEDPSDEKMAEFGTFIYNFGYILKGSNEIHPKELQALLKKVEGTKEEAIINTLMLRSLRKARYSPDTTQHFGLAANYYTHFTSPIRRYPDLQIHRIIKLFINNKLNEKVKDKLKKILPDVCDQSSERERNAADAERDTVEYKMTEYMSERIGNVYEGIVSGVTSFGVFVELHNTIEGLIRVEALEDDYYVFDEKNYKLVGERTNKAYKIGDTVYVKVINTNLEKIEIDFEFISKEDYEEFSGDNK